MSPPPVAAAAPPRVHDRLRAGPDGPVPIVHRGLHAVYVDVGGRCVGVVASTAVRVPCAVRVADLDLSALDRRTARLVGGVLHLGDTPLRIGRLLDVRVPRRPTRGRADVVTGHRLAAAIGRGPGLTPEADDVLAGWLAVHRSMEVATAEVDDAVRAALPRTTLLSAALLDCALQGEVVPEFAQYVAALTTPEEPVRAQALAGLGHTSGAALLRGARLGWNHLHAAGGVAA